jgi:hypothetical protein
MGIRPSNNNNKNSSSSRPDKSNQEKKEDNIINDLSDFQDEKCDIGTTRACQKQL